MQPVLGKTLVGLLSLGAVAIGARSSPASARTSAPARRCRDAARRRMYVWAFVNLTAATTTAVLLVTLPLPVFVVARALAGWLITTLGVVTTFVLAVRAGRSEDLVARATSGGA